ncbi:MAG: DUF222 domain-containing protein [Mycobacteriales bacterium]
MPATASASIEEQRAVLNAIEELEARKAQLHAESMVLRAELARVTARSRSGFAEMELAGTALVGQIRAARELDDASRLVANFPKLHALLADGAVFVPAVEAILLATRRCTPEVQAGVDARLASQVVDCNVTDVRRLVAHTVLAVEAELDPELTQQRLDQANKDAHVWVSASADGMTSIGAVLDAVAGRRWAVDFEQLVRAQVVLDKRAGVQRTLQAVKAEVFAHLPTLVLELVRAARDGRLAELAELGDLDPQTAAELAQLAQDTLDLPIPDVADETTDEPVVEEDPFDEAILAQDPWPDQPFEPGEPPAQDPPEPGPPPWAAAAQDAAFWRTAQPPGEKDPYLEVLLLRCLQMPLQTPTTVNLHLPMATALDLTNAPGILEGHGPLDARRIRQLLPDAHLREIYIDQLTGVPLGAQPKPERPRPGQARLDNLARRLRPVTLVDEVESQHDPTAALAEFVKLRDQKCSGPGCSMPASRCDLDHELEWPTGPTAEWNLADNSRRCHGAKHHGWQTDRSPDGTTDWTSPTGRIYTSRSTWPPPPKLPKPTFQIYLPRLDLDLQTETEHPAPAR